MSASAVVLIAGPNGEKQWVNEVAFMYSMICRHFYFFIFMSSQCMSELRNVVYDEAVVASPAPQVVLRLF